MRGKLANRKLKDGLRRWSMIQTMQERKSDYPSDMWACRKKRSWRRGGKHPKLLKRRQRTPGCRIRNPNALECSRKTALQRATGLPEQGCYGLHPAANSISGFRLSLRTFGGLTPAILNRQNIAPGRYTQALETFIQY